jgi:hypothetical protein
VFRRRTRSIYKLVYQGVFHPLTGRPQLFDRAEILDILKRGIPRPKDRKVSRDRKKPTPAPQVAVVRPIDTSVRTDVS